MSEDLQEICTMITTAHAGDGDRLLDILEKVVEKLHDLERRIARVE